LQDIVDNLVAEYDGEPRALDVQTSVYGEDIALGDTLDVDYPSENITREMRAVKVTTEIGDSGRLQRVTLSNRDLTRQNRDAKRAADLERFNSGHGGFIDRDQTTTGWNPAGDGVPQTLEIPAWPDDIVREDRVELTVQGRAWRSPVDATGHSHSISVTHPSHSHDVNHPSHSHDVTHPSHNHSISATAANNTEFKTTTVKDTSTQGNTLPSGTSWIDLESYSFNSNTSFLQGNVSILNADTNGKKFIAVRYYNSTDGRYLPGTAGIIIRIHENSAATFGPFLDATNVNGETIKFQAQHVFSQSNDTDIEHLTAVAGAGFHVHDVSDTSTSALGTTETSTSALGTNTTSDTALGTTTSETSDTATDLTPGIIDSFDSNSYYPSDVDIAVNGTTVTSIGGSSTSDWQTTIDLAGQLTAGANTITALPTSTRGELNLTLASELFRRGTTTP
jgi:hypothetical protein